MAFSVFFILSVFYDFMKKIFNKYATFLKRKWLSERGFEYYFWHIQKFFEYTNCTIKDFENIKKFRKRYDKIILRESLCNESKKKHLKCARIFGDFLKEEGKITENVARLIKPPKVQLSLPLPVEDSEIRDIFTIISRRWKWFLAYRNRVIIETFLNTGLRRAELINLKRSEIFEDHIFVKNWKGRKDRVVYLPADFIPILKDFVKVTDGKSEFLFFLMRSEKISIRAMSAIFEAIRKEGKMDRLHAHKMRHTYASRVLENWISLSVLRDQLWHSSIATTNRYIAVRNQYRKEQMEKFKL